MEAGRLREFDEMRIGLAVEFDQEAAETVDEQEGADEPARLVTRVGPPEQEPEDQEQQDSLEPGLVELARMAGNLAAGRKDHRPGHVRRPPPQLLVHEIGEASEE